MRIRTIKPTFWKNEELAQVSSDACLLAIGLLNYADDEGYFNANPALIRAEIFPIREISDTIPALLQELSKTGYIELYETSDSKNYGKVVTFLEHQYINKPTESKIKYLDLLPKASGSIPVVVSAGKEGKGKEGKGVSPIDISIFIDSYQNTLAKKILKVSPDRKRKIEKFAKIYTLEQFNEALERIKRSNFLQTEWTGWDIDWICTEANFIKIMEGKYEKSEPITTTKRESI